jgi:hypothetical protein
MRLEQRIGRIYRYGQKDRVLVYNLRYADTIEDTVRSYLEEKVDRAAAALAQVTGEDPDDVKNGLIGQLEEALDVSYEDLYRQALRTGRAEWTREQIDKGLQHAREAWKLAYDTLFRHDLSCFSPDQYATRVRSFYDLKDVKDFILCFIRLQRREIRKDQSGFFGFLTPDVLAEYKLPERYNKVTFDRDVAANSTDPELQFMAFGHPFVEAAVEFCGSYDSGGLASRRFVRAPVASTVRGIQFNFVVKRPSQPEDLEETRFDFHPIVVDEAYGYNEEASKQALMHYSEAGADEDQFGFAKGLDIDKASSVARTVLADRLGEAVWDEDIHLLNVAWVVLTPS